VLLLGGTIAVVIHQTIAPSADQKAVIASAEALVRALAAGDSDGFAAGLFVQDDADRRLAVSFGGIARATAELDAALVARFGDTDEVWRIRYTFSMMSGIPLLGYQGQRVHVEVSGDEAFFRSALWGPDSLPLHFVRSNGEWKLMMHEGWRDRRWLDEAVALNQAFARKHYDFAMQVREGRYMSPLEAWLAWAKRNEWAGYTDLPRPAVARRK
jgi:hypothetical protein